MGTGRDIPPEELLHLTSLGEVLGGFAHEIAQPLNAMMIAAQVVQLRVNRTLLPDEEKAYINERLDMVTSQVSRTSDIVEQLRRFGSGRSSDRGDGDDIQAVFDKVMALLGQQFVSRGIELRIETVGRPSGLKSDGTTEEMALIQALAFARDAVQNIAAWHQERNLSYAKSVNVKLLNVNGAPAVHLAWDQGATSADGTVIRPDEHTGLALVKAVLASNGGTVEAGAFSLLITFSKD
jgi:phosphoglycerate-specific signal transduction histidine kinase